jgi:hypothetical protein
MFCRSLSATTKAPAPARTLAELLRDLGVVLRWRMRHGAGTDGAPLLLESLRWDSNLALAFVNLRASVQFRAMVEDWPLPRIQEAVRAQLVDTLRPQEGDPPRISLHPGADVENERDGLQRPEFLIWLAAYVFAVTLAAGVIGGFW